MKAGTTLSHLLMIISMCIGLAYISPALAATLLPLAEQTFTDANGIPLAGGSVQFYVPNTTTPKDTWKDAAGVTLNTNPVILDAAGRAIIYGSGAYRQVVKDSLGNPIWDQVTTDTAPATGIAWGGTSSGTANAQTVVASTFSASAGTKLMFIAGFSNTGALTVNPNGSGAITVVKPGIAGSVALIGNEVSAGNLVELDYDGTQLNLIDPVETNLAGPLTTLASATTTSVGTIPSHNVDITGVTAITAFGSAATTSYPIYFLKFEGVLTLTHNGTSLILPGSANITTAVGDTAVAEYLGAGNWQVRQYNRATGKPVAAGLVNVQVFTSGSGTYTPTVGASRALVYVTGGGGGGGGAGGSGAGAAGGGGGATAQLFTSALASVSYTVGIGGTAGANTGGTGGTGGQSIFGTTTANGGLGGTGNNTGATSANNVVVAGGAGSSTTANATLTIGGTAGNAGFNLNAPSTAVDLPGFGGGTFWGPGPPGPLTAAGPGLTGAAPGTGGTGALGPTQLGGVGAAGIIVVYEYGY